MANVPAMAPARLGATRRTPCATGHNRGHDPAAFGPVGRGYLDARAGRPLAVCFHKYQRTAAAMLQTSHHEDGAESHHLRRTLRHAQRFLSAHARIHSHFKLRRHRLAAH
jgi:hypothetical protein